MADVIEASATQLVLLVVDAVVREPCRQLTPLLEQVTAQANGAVRLAKMNIDEHPTVAQQLQVQSIPAVFAFKNGQPVIGFVGARKQIKEFNDPRWDDELAASPVEEMLAMAAHGSGDMARARPMAKFWNTTHPQRRDCGSWAGAFCRQDLDQAGQMPPWHRKIQPIRKLPRAETRAATKSMLGDDTSLMDAARNQTMSTRFHRLSITGPASAPRRWTPCWKSLPESAIGKTACAQTIARFFDAYGAGGELVAAAHRLSSICSATILCGKDPMSADRNR